jgi:hypothetical protein
VRAIELLAVLGRIPPEVWDVIVGQDPSARHRGDQMSLNPQPLPPREEFLLGAAEMAHALVGIAVEADIRGDSAVNVLSEVVEEWCATPWPRKWPWPGPGPRPDEGPSPDPWRINVGRAIGAVVFASVASRLGEGEVRTNLVKSAENLAEVAARG